MGAQHSPMIFIYLFIFLFRMAKSTTINITWGGLARLAGLARFTGILARLWNIWKINFAITWKNLSPASWDPGIAMPGSRLAGLKIYHVVAIAGPARLARTTLSRH